MPRSHRDQLPRALVRDLLGIARALYRAELAGGANPSRLARLEEIGKMFRTAYDLACRCPPDTMGGRAAWGWAEKATEALGAFVSDEVQVSPMVQAIAAKLFNR